MSTEQIHRYFIKLSFDGSKFHGWQIQQNANSIQQELNKGLATLLRKEIETTGCGRTDTGVHAKLFFVHFDSVEISDLISFTHKLNAIIPWEIAIESIFKVEDTYHARFSAIARTYEYHIVRNKNPFMIGKAWYNINLPEISDLNKFVEILKEYSDFSAFSKSNTQTFTNNCKISHAKWEEKSDGTIVFTIRADRFLRNMVRAIVGTLIMSAEKKLDERNFREIIEGKNRSEAGVSVPAHGLFLTNIEYPFPIK